MFFNQVVIWVWLSLECYPVTKWKLRLTLKHKLFTISLLCSSKLASFTLYKFIFMMSWRRKSKWCHAYHADNCWTCTTFVIVPFLTNTVSTTLETKRLSHQITKKTFAPAMLPPVNDDPESRFESFTKTVERVSSWLDSTGQYMNKYSDNYLSWQLKFFIISSFAISCIWHYSWLFSNCYVIKMSHIFTIDYGIRSWSCTETILLNVLLKKRKKLISQFFHERMQWSFS